MLSTDLPPADSTSSPDDIDKCKEDAQANILFPDQRDHKEIVLSSLSESATGQERKEVYNFGFDRVGFLHSFVMSFIDLPAGI
jgi:kinesin family protein C1